MEQGYLHGQHGQGASVRRPGLCAAGEKLLGQNSICYGVYCGGEQVGFGRIITDYATTFYICDVIIDENHRGRGLGKMLLACMMDSENFKSITGLLVTSDAHGLYRKYGFNPLENVFMLRRGEPNI
jgi:ribosomal protein S18 acetylase RimI-like enzyme